MKEHIPCLTNHNLCAYDALKAPNENRDKTVPYTPSTPMSAQCSSALDCVISSSPEVLKLCYRDVSFANNSFCGCDSLMGLVGTSCDETSNQTEFLTLSGMLVMFFLFYLLSWNIWNGITIFQRKALIKEMYEKSLVEIAKFKVVYASTLTSIALLTLSLERCILLANLFGNRKKELTSYKVFIGEKVESVQYEHQFLEEVLLSISFFCTVLSILIVMLYLRDIISLSKLETRNYFIPYCVFGSWIVVSIVVTLLDSTLYITISNFIKAICALIITILYWKTKLDMFDLLNELNNFQGSTNTLQKIVSRMFQLNTISLVVLASLFTSYGIGLHFVYDIVQPGEIHYASVLKLLSVISIAITNIGVMLFTTKFLNNPSLILEEFEAVVNKSRQTDISYHEPTNRNSLTSPHVEGGVTKINKSVKKKSITFVNNSGKFSSSRGSLASPLGSLQFTSSEPEQMVQML